ncbi:aminotransferase class I/II-fold pyridoxal phosphate-dependent enzyme [Candidatus Micrarchaeota archaeon]|nr:aminotransferase class I/II-fold pyridoxal phosphate-dependent enzyme [Candidatus Micrarchaeota archaeon]
MIILIQPSSKSELVSYPIRDIVQEAMKLEKLGTKMIYLNIGDPAPFGFRPPQHVLDAASEALTQNYSGYAPSSGDPELRQTIADFEKVSPENVFVTSGLSEGIDFLFQAMVDPGRNIILPVPTYPLYLTKERINYGTVDFYDCDSNFEPDLESLRKNINKYTKAILVINPNNPTGAVYSRKTLQGILDIAGEHKLPIISDDVYDQMVFDGDITPMRTLCKDVPVVCGNSLSKNYIYPGARVGYLAFHGEWGTMPDVIQRLSNQRLSVNWEMQRAYIAAIKGNHDHIHKFNAELKLRRDVLVKRVNQIEGLSVAPPKGAFYSFIKVESNKWKNDVEFVKGLLKEGVVVVPGSGFAPTMKGNYFRLVFLPKPEQLESAFDKIEKFMKK